MNCLFDSEGKDLRNHLAERKVDFVSHNPKMATDEFNRHGA
ncbi:MAG: hypothetical protein Q8S11_04530 [Daejeonella sp.]|nr:hypothetical protein [Daejeonella sp.]